MSMNVWRVDPAVWDEAAPDAQRREEQRPSLGATGATRRRRRWERTAKRERRRALRRARRARRKEREAQAKSTDTKDEVTSPDRDLALRPWAVPAALAHHLSACDVGGLVDLPPITGGPRPLVEAK
jgi:hypothetical protein